MSTQQRTALKALTVALKGEAVAHVEHDGKVEVGASSGRRYELDYDGTVTER
jgi:hypothetical protein